MRQILPFKNDGRKEMNPVSIVKEGVSKVRTYWKTPPLGRYMTFKEIAAYSGGGIGAYMIITLGNACLLSTNNVLLSGTLGVGPKDMYILYIIAVLANIPLTGIRALSQRQPITSQIVRCLTSLTNGSIARINKIIFLSSFFIGY